MDLTKHDIKKGILSIYEAGNFEVFIQLVLYKDNSFYYQYKYSEFNVFSTGRWVRQNNILVLNSKIDSTNVPVNLLFFNTDTAKTYYLEQSQHDNLRPPFYDTKFQVPINLKKELLPDAMVYINNDTTYCFPFFDTCVGTFNKIENIKVSFGKGFRSKWISLNTTDFRRCLCIAQVDFLFSNYISYKNHRLKIRGKKLMTLN